MKERYVMEIIYDKISECKGCCSNCPSKKMAKYIDDIGMDEFYKRYISNNLPEEIVQILNKKIEVLNL